jgi:hypothetical protein
MPPTNPKKTRPKNKKTKEDISQNIPSAVEKE